MASATNKKFDRDRLARGYAKRHLDTDNGVQEIHYLPANAPPREIRFVEVNPLISETADLEPIDFGVDIGSAEEHVLLVLDVSPTQWQAIRRHRLALPAGWALDGSIAYRR